MSEQPEKVSVLCAVFSAAFWGGVVLGVIWVGVLVLITFNV